MAITSQTGLLGFGAQTAKGTIAATLYQHRASDIDLGAVSDDRLGPPEVGGIPTPTIPYRAGIMATGGATINPRLENTFGWILEGAMGACSSTSGEDVYDSTIGTTYTFYHHAFTFKTDDASFVPWMTFVKDVPAVVHTEHHVETYVDCKVIGLTFTLPNDGLINARVDVVGRMPSSTTYTQFATDPSITFGNTQMEDYPSIPIGCTIGGFLKIPTYSTAALAVAAATVSLTNAPLDIRQEKVYGSPYLEDVTITGRQLTVDMVLKWTDPKLYRDILTGSTTGTTWTSMPFVSDLDVFALSPGKTPSQGTNYQLRVQAPAVMYQVAGPIRLAGNNAVMMRLTGTAIASTSTVGYAVIHLGNEKTNYTWPT